MSSDLATVATYWFASDADLAKNALEAAGIDAVIENENMLRFGWFNMQEVPSVRLRVRPEDALRAGEVLNTKCELLEEIGEADEPRDGMLVCAACESRDVGPNHRALAFAVVAALAIGISVAVGQTVLSFFIVAAAAVFALIGDRWLCANCGNTWN